MEFQMLQCNTKTQKLPSRNHTGKVCRNRKPSSRKTGKNIASRATQGS